MKKRSENALKRMASAAAAAVMLVSSAACSSTNDSTSIGGDSSTSQKASQTADKSVVNSYTAEDIAGDHSFEYVERMSALGDTGKVLISGSDATDNCMMIADSEFTSFTPVDFSIEEEGNVQTYWSAAASPDGVIYVLATVTDYGDMELPDYDDPDFDWESFDYEALEEAANTSYRLYSISEDGEILTEAEITGLDEYKEGDYLYLGGIYPFNGGKVMVNASGSEDKYILVNTDGEISGEVDLGDTNWFYTYGYDRDNAFCFLAYGDNGMVIRTIDPDTAQLTGDDIKLTGTELNGANCFAKGTGEYRAYISGSTSLYGLKDDGSVKELINWIDSDMNGDYINGVFALEDGDFIVYQNDYTNNTRGFFRLTKRDPSELENVQVITLGMMYADTNVTSVVTDFNKKNNGYRIKIQDYSKYNDWDDESEKMLNSAESQLKLDIVSGNAPDMIYSYDASLMTQLASKGVFADLYDYLGTDGGVSKDELMPGILSICEFDGKLLGLSPTFGVTTLAAKTKFADKENWTLDEFIDVANNLPDGMELFQYGTTKESFFSSLMYGALSFIDPQTATCTFDSPEFVKLLDFCNRFPDEEDEIDWETASQDEMDAYWNEKDAALRNDKALLQYLSFYDMRQYARCRYGDFGEDITLVGYPSDSGSGAVISPNMCFSILSSAAEKEACWSFISSFFTEDYQNSGRLWAIPALKSAFEKKLDDAMEDPYWLDEDGKKQTYKDQYYIMDEPVDIPNLSKEERDYIYDYIMNASGTNTNYFSEEVSNIINEEIQAFFKGDRSAQDTADLIQNRVSILVSEQS
ncbi:MAG: extracellular solute-binding protein [Ruminococcus sp.]|nr:extracellular solute-binding protein [Ruminococcus sp.]